MRVGTIGTSVITERMISALQQAGHPVVAVCSRSAAKGREFADRHGVKKAYSDLESMLQDPDIDTIYVASPNSLHYGQARRALKTGHDVICEKPFTSTREQAVDLFETAEKHGRRIFEAITTLYTPNYRLLKANLEKIGQPRVISCSFSQYSSRYQAYLDGQVTNVFDPAYDGGALRDLGVYNLHFVTGLYGMPDTMQMVTQRGYNGVDLDGTVILGWQDKHAVLTQAKNCSAPNCVLVEGEKGTLMVQSSPGRVQNLRFVPLKGDMIGKTEKDLSADIGIIQDENHMVYEVMEFARIMEENDESAYREAMAQTLRVMDILDILDPRPGAEVCRETA